MILVYVEGAGDELSAQAIAFARGLGEDVQAVLVGTEATLPGVSVAHVAQDPRLDAYAPAAHAQAIATLAATLNPTAVVAPGSDRRAVAVGGAEFRSAAPVRQRSDAPPGHGLDAADQ